MTFNAAMQCLTAPNARCLATVELATPFLLFAILIGIGIWVARTDRQAYLRLLWRGFLVALTLLTAGLLAIGWFFAFDPGSINGIETSPFAQTLWVLSIALFGAGLSLLGGVAGFAGGGWLSGQFKMPAPEKQKAGRPANLVIAIDGPAASGKGTLAKRLATHYGVPCLDTGLLYRAVARDVVARGGKLEDAAAAVAAARALNATTLNDMALRGPAAGDAASIVAKIPDVRAALLEYQRTFARTPGGAVLDGRDIGTVVCPDADIKIFVTATAEERARRRHVEHQSRGEDVSYETVLAEIKSRDARDSGRDIAPMEAASDAMRLDTTNLDADQAFVAVVELIKQAKPTAD